MEWPEDPVEFCAKFLGFQPTAYQEKLLRDGSQFIVARWARQAGKTHCVAALLLWLCLRTQGFNVLVLAPSIRQSKITIRKVTGFLSKLPKYAALKPYRTRVEFYNGSRIQAFPNSPETIRGEPAVNMVYCLPGYVRVLLSDGSTVPIENVSVGQLVLSYNTFTRLLEPKRVLKVAMNPRASRQIVRIKHNTGSLDCTLDHRIYTENRGYVPAGLLTNQDDLLARPETSVEATVREKVQPNPRTTDPRRSSRRFMPFKTRKSTEKLAPNCQPLLQASRVCSVQVLDAEGVRPKPSWDGKEPWMGHMEHPLQQLSPPQTHRVLSPRIPERKEDNHERLAGEDHYSSSNCNMVHGRWLPEQSEHFDQHSRIYARRMPAPARMALVEVGNRSNYRTRQSGERAFPQIQRIRERQAVLANSALRDSEHGIQGHPSSEESAPRKSPSDKAASRDSYLRELPPTFQHHTPPEAHLQPSVQTNAQTSPPTFLQGHLQSQTGISADAEEDGEGVPSNSLHVLWNSVYPSQWPPEDLQSTVPGCPDKKKPEALGGEKTSEIVYNIEVEDNHNFFADGVLVSNCDEASYIRDDAELYSAVIFTLGTTNGRFLATSTPGSRDTLFYAMCTDEVTFRDVSRHHVSYLDALEPNGPLRREILEKVKQQLAGDPWRWRREMEAEFADDADAWLSMELITKCVDRNLDYIPDSAILTPN